VENPGAASVSALVDDEGSEVFLAPFVYASCLDVALPTAGIGTELLADQRENQIEAQRFII